MVRPVSGARELVKLCLWNLHAPVAMESLLRRRENAFSIAN